MLFLVGVLAFVFGLLSLCCDAWRR